MGQNNHERICVSPVNCTQSPIHRHKSLMEKSGLCVFRSALSMSFYQHYRFIALNSIGNVANYLSVSFAKDSL